MHTKEQVAVLSSVALVALLFTANTAFASANWSAYGQTTLPNGHENFHPIAQGTTFAFPDATSSSPQFVNYLLADYPVSLTESNTITATFTITTSSATTAFAGNPDGGNPAISFVRLFVQANLPNDHSATCTAYGNGVEDGKGQTGTKNVLNYWWADVGSAVYNFVPGSATITLTASLSNTNWSGICGNAGSSNVAGFDLALANIKEVGLSFGSNYFYSNGLGVDGTTGTAIFQLTSFTIS
jgi:hypothetical protein